MWRTVRVFVSSTFRDMHAEREHLASVVFPELRESLLRQRIHLIDVDLRWGVAREPALSSRAVAACLRQIDACRPYFVALIGQRYGSVPRRLHTVRGVTPGWLERQRGKSVTEIEIAHALRVRGTCAFVYLRDPSYLHDVPSAKRSEYAAADARLVRLRRRVRARSAVYPCTWNGDGIGGLEAFGARVRHDLETRILADAGPASAAATGENDVEDDLQEQFIEDRTYGYVRRIDVERRIARAVGLRGHPIVAVTGPSGAGKSTLLAQWLRTEARGALVLSCFAGASPESTDLGRMLARFARQLAAALGESDPAEGSAAFPPLLRRAAASRKVVIVVDSLEAVRATGDDVSLAWLPREWPANLTLLAGIDESSGQGRQLLAELARRPVTTIAVGTLTPPQVEAFSRSTVSLMGKVLDREHRNLLRSRLRNVNALFLKVALEEMRTLGSPELVDRFIAHLPAGDGATIELFADVLERLQRDFDASLVRAVASYLACAFTGLREVELRDLIAQHDVQQEHLFPVLRRLRPYLRHSGDAIVLGHTALDVAIRKRFLDSPMATDAIHQILANYFFGSSDPRRRSLHAPAHLLAAEQYGRFRDWLRDGMNVLGAALIDRTTLCGLIRRWEESSGDRMRDIYAAAIDDPDRYDAVLVSMLAEIFGPIGDRDAAHALWESLARRNREDAGALHHLGHVSMRLGDATRALEIHREQEHLAAVQGDENLRALALGSQGNALQTLGRMDEALTRYRESAAIHERLRNHASLGVTYTNIGAIAHRRGHWQEALEWYARAEEKLVTANDSQTLATCLHNQAVIHRMSGDFTRALVLLDRADLLDREAGNAHGLQRNARLHASILAEQGNAGAALEISERQSADVVRIRDPRQILISLLDRAKVLERTGDYAAALGVLREARTRATGSHEDLIEILAAEAGVYTNAGDAAAAERALAALEREFTRRPS